ncbi:MULTISPECIES: penicillin-binding protein activator [Thiorhodovibrio]|uniref:penicillin-binding protein activator n=1 Tax=Thiorhodovibrio TaxID=61593 RepID=UPI0019144428|nr:MULTISPECIES: penicillin-binding protein activator [Thiorhodovibrio]
MGAGLLLLAGCATTPGADMRELLASVPPAALAEVEATATSGDAVAAAEAYLALAKKSQPPARQALELRAAEAFYQAGQSQRALRTLSAIDSGRLSAGARNQERLLAARVAVQAALPERALNALGRLGSFGLSESERIERLGLEAAAYRQNGDPVQAAQVLDELDRLLEDASQRRDNQVSLLLTLSTLQPASLQRLKTQGNQRMRGWASLAELLASANNADSALLTRYGQWRSQHGSMPIDNELPRAYFATLTGDYPAGSDAWALLPQGGRFSSASQAIVQGMRQADGQNDSGRRPQLHLADSTANADGAYQRAVAAGADLVIGPLQKPAVNALSGYQAVPVPTLALNQNTNDRSLPSQLYQFALSPEDEAVSAANHAWASGFRSTLLLYPSGPWGSRMANAFRVHWLTLGGKLAGEVVYGDTNASKVSSTETLLAPSTGDLIFMVASSADAPAIWRGLAIANTRHLPVLATSHVYNGTADGALALTGLYFVDIPWLIEPTSSASRAFARPPGGSGNASLTRLKAMGIDSYRLAPRTEAMSAHSGHFFPGVSGGLTFDGTGRVLRNLPLARMEATGPTPVARIANASAKTKTAQTSPATGQFASR